ncbi:hypothetical protein PQX77_011586 [Marasmius sp. AFHP31]|nr:hypothetical protein PQX77_011586 [Marasmius sp. AFHP31]
MFSQFFQKARNFQITGGSFNHVQGDQINYTTTIVQAKEKEPTEFDEYYEVKRGGIFKINDIGCSAHWDDGNGKKGEQGEPRVERTFCTARLLEQPGMVFTVLQYSGPDAQRAFEQDFRMLSRILTSNASQIFGYSKSEIPSLILYNELVPATLLDIGQIGQKYVSSLATQLGCKSAGELWLDTGRGVLCCGAPGPNSLLYRGDWFHTTLPLTTECLQEDVFIRFLASQPESLLVDFSVVTQFASSVAWWYRGFTGVPERYERVSQSIVISTSTNFVIAVADSAWQSERGYLSDPKLLGNGLTRFTLAGPPSFSLVWNRDTDFAWISQASRIFHAHGITLEEDLSSYRLVYPFARVRSRGKCSKAQLKRQSQQPIYFFVCSPPSNLRDNRYHTVTSIHYWSFHEDGGSPLTHDACCDLGLPIKLQFRRRPDQSYWSPSVSYRHLHQYQLLRGFDPFTTDFSCHLGFHQPIFRPADDSDRVEFLQGLLDHSDDLFDLVSSSLVRLVESPPESRPSSPPCDISELERLIPVTSTPSSATSETREGPASFWSPIFFPIPLGIPGDLGTAMDSPDTEID